MLRYCHGVDSKKDCWLLVESGIAVAFITVPVTIGLILLFVSWVQGETKTGEIIICFTLLLFLSPFYIGLIKYALWNIERYQVSENGILVKTKFYQKLIKWEDIQEVSVVSVWIANYKSRSYIAVICSPTKRALSEGSVPHLTDCFRNRNSILTIRHSDVRFGELKECWDKKV